MSSGCVIEGCEGKHKAHGFCVVHYMRWRRTGVTETRQVPSLADRFWAKVEKTESCWLWRGAITPDGYGLFRTGRRPDGRSLNRSAHRLGWQLSGREIPAGMELDHLCFNRNCVNPEHLRVVTHEENMRSKRPKSIA